LRFRAGCERGCEQDDEADANRISERVSWHDRILNENCGNAKCCMDSVVP
jgi:hypothetical protein